MNSKPMRYVILFLGICICANQRIAAQENIYSGLLLNDLIEAQSAQLVKLTVAQYLSSKEQDSVWNICLGLEKRIQKQFQQEKDSIPISRNSLMQQFFERFLEVRKADMPLFTNEGILAQAEIQQFPYLLNDEYYWKAAKKYRLKKEWSKAGMIFNKLAIKAQHKEIKEKASISLKQVEAEMYAQQKDLLNGRWKHTSGITGCFSEILPVNTGRVIELGGSIFRVFEKDQCVIQSTYTLQPVFDWDYTEALYVKIHIETKGESWNLNAYYKTGAPAEMRVSYPAPRPFTTNQTTDWFTKETGALTVKK